MDLTGHASLGSAFEATRRTVLILNFGKAGGHQKVPKVLTPAFTYNGWLRNGLTESLVSFENFKVGVMPSPERGVHWVVCDHKWNSSLGVLLWLLQGICPRDLMGPSLTLFYNPRRVTSAFEVLLHLSTLHFKAFLLRAQSSKAKKLAEGNVIPAVFGVARLVLKVGMSICSLRVQVSDKKAIFQLYQDVQERYLNSGRGKREFDGRMYTVDVILKFTQLVNRVKPKKKDIIDESLPLL